MKSIILTKIDFYTIDYSKDPILGKDEFLCSVYIYPLSCKPISESTKKVIRSHFREKVYGKGLYGNIDFDWTDKHGVDIN